MSRGGASDLHACQTDQSSQTIHVKPLRPTACCHGNSSPRCEWLPRTCLTGGGFQCAAVSMVTNNACHGSFGLPRDSAEVGPASSDMVDFAPPPVFTDERPPSLWQLPPDTCPRSESVWLNQTAVACLWAELPPLVLTLSSSHRPITADLDFLDELCCFYLRPFMFPGELAGLIVDPCQVQEEETESGG